MYVIFRIENLKDGVAGQFIICSVKPSGPPVFEDFTTEAANHIFYTSAIKISKKFPENALPVGTWHLLEVPSSKSVPSGWRQEMGTLKWN